MRTFANFEIFHSLDTITLDAADPKEVERLNDVLEPTLGRALGDPSPIAGQRWIVPVTDPAVRADQVLGTLDEHGEGGGAGPETLLYAGTHVLDLFGRNMPHGFFTPSPASIQSTPLPWVAPPSGRRRPVVAVLDSGVQPHRWFPVTGDDDPFLLDAETVPGGWKRPPEADRRVRARLAGRQPETIRVRGVKVKEASHYHEAGHATFIAGIIRAAAPGARVLSVRVAGPDGVIRESVATHALDWLAGYYKAGNPVDVVCMAFGRAPGDTGDPQALTAMAEQLGRLDALGVKIVASAGNDHLEEEEIFPAAFPMVTAVGAGTAAAPEPFSNVGPWVDVYRRGAEVQSTLPPDQWASWSGTSFSVAAYAGELAAAAQGTAAAAGGTATAGGTAAADVV